MTSRHAKDATAILKAIEEATRPSNLTIVIVDSGDAAEAIQKVPDEQLETKVSGQVRGALDKKAEDSSAVAATPDVAKIVKSRNRLLSTLRSFLSQLGWKLIVHYVAGGIAAFAGILIDGIWYDNHGQDIDAQWLPILGDEQANDPVDKTGD